MKTWEYLRLTVECELWNASVKAIDGQVGLFKPDSDFDEVLSELGSEGWELIGTAPTFSKADEEMVNYVFKRPISENG